MSDGKVMIIHLIAEKRLSIILYIFKKRFYVIKMSQYFAKPYQPLGGDINVKADLSNYATKADIKNISHVDTSNFALKKNYQI